MKRNLLNKAAAESIIARVESLKPDSGQLWGEMNGTEMLMHCNSCNRQIFDEGRSARKTTFGQYLLRIIALYIAPNFKKGLRTEARHISKGRVDNQQFEEQRQEFVRLIKRFHEITTALTLTHPAFGNISTQQWGIAAYKHMDHHLRQFGV